jgi:Concanavalin A-like lectin/glucanases superfamily
MPNLGLGLSLSKTRLSGGGTPLIPQDGLSLWLKADKGISQFNISSAPGLISNAASFDASSNKQYLENTEISPSFINKIVISGAGTATSNGTYTRENGGTNQFFGPNGNYIHNTGGAEWGLWDTQLYNPDTEGYGNTSYITGSGSGTLFVDWDVISGEANAPVGTLTSSPFSISTWFKMRSSTNTPQAIWGTAGDDFISLYVQNNILYLYNDNLDGLTGPSIDLNTWYHAVVTISSTESKLYINATLADSISYSEANSSWTGFGLSDFRIDSGNPHHYQADVLIDETGIWSRVLTEGEISDLYNGGDGLSFDHGSFPSDGIKAYWKLDETSGNRADSTENGRNLNNLEQGVLSWADQSGEGNNASFEFQGEQPTFVSSFLNGKPAIRFNGQGQILQVASSASLDFTAETSCFIVVKYDGDGLGNDVIYIKNADDGSPGYPAMYGMVGVSSANGNVSFPLNVGGWSDHDSGVSISDGIPRLFSMIFNTSVDQSIYCNGILTGQQVLGDNISTSSGTLQIGGYNASFDNSEFFNGQIAEIIMYNRAVTNIERQQVETYLKNKYALVLPTNGLSLWLKADSGVTEDVIDSFISEIIISGAGTETSNGTYTRSSGGSTQFDGPNGNYIYSIGGGEWVLFDTQLYNPDIENDGWTSYASYDDLATWTIFHGLPDAPIGSTHNTDIYGVVSWADKSGNDNNGTADNQYPLLVSNAINGKPAIEFNGVDTRIIGSQPMATQVATIFVVAKHLTDTVIGMMYQQFDTGDTMVFYKWGVEGSPLRIANGYNLTGSSIIGNDFTIFNAVVNGVDSKLYVNGVIDAEGDAGNDNSIGDYYLAYWVTGDHYTNVQIAEVVVYNRVLPDIERQQVEAYLNTKYAIY